MKRFNSAASAQLEPETESPPACRAIASERRPAIGQKPACRAVASEKRPVVVGTRIHCILYGGMDGIIYNIRGAQRPDTVRQLGGGAVVMGGNASFDIVFPNHYSLGVPESVVRGVQWRIYDTVATADEIAAAKAACDAELARARQEAEVHAAELAKEREALLAQYGRKLELTSLKKNSGGKLAAINIRTQLREAFPGVKFSVRSDYNSVDIRWELGPTVNQVRAITDNYQRGHFDGMESMSLAHSDGRGRRNAGEGIYKDDPDNVWPGLFGGADYVNEYRSWPRELDEAIGRKLCEYQHVEYAGDFTQLYGENDQRGLRDYVIELMNETPWPAGATIKDIEYVEWDNRPPGMHSCFRIVFNEPPKLPACRAIASERRPTVDGAKLLETRHTKTQALIFVVQLGERVSRPEYERLNNQARALGGYYSSYRRDGAIPGFIFKEKPKAEQFLAAVSPSPGGEGRGEGGRILAPVPATITPVPETKPAIAATKTPLSETIPQTPDPRPQTRIPSWRQRFARTI
jgi:hypothetical protein